MLLTVRQLQDLLQVDRITIYRMLGDGRLQGFKVGGQWRFSRRAIEDWLHEQEASLTAQEPPMAEGSLHPSPEALPLSCIRAIQEIFAQALGVGAVTTAADGSPLTPVANCCKFCDLLLRTEIGRQRCVESWRVSGAEVRGTSRSATCHAGLRYLSGRIEVHGRFVAAAHAGPYLERPADQQAWDARILELAAACSLHIQELRQALDQVPVLDQDHQRQLSRLLKRMALTFSEIGEERFDLLGRLQRIAKITEF